MIEIFVLLLLGSSDSDSVPEGPGSVSLSDMTSPPSTLNTSGSGPPPAKK